MFAEWLRMASSGPVVRRGLKYATVVGIILIAINHGNAILEGTVSAVRWFQMGLTALVPYCVSVLSSVGAMMDDRRERIRK